jgi:amino acid transporter
MGILLVICALIIGASALVMSFTMNIGGANETAATSLFAIAFLICLLKAYTYARRREIGRHREWMIRTFGIGLGVATIRPIVGIFFAFRRLTPHEFFGIAFWFGFTITLVAAEAWIDYTRYHQDQVSKFASERAGGYLAAQEPQPSLLPTSSRH